MKSRLRTRQSLQPLLAAAILAAASVPGLAGIFSKNQPVPDWALQASKTHTPDYAKDASSVILYEEYLESVDASGRATERHRKVVRILKPQGRNTGNAACSVGYDEDEKVNYFRAWTIAADERQYQAQDTDFAEVGDTSIPVMLSTQKARVALPPAVDVGATVVCESEELLQPYLHETVWEFQRSVPIVFEALEVDLPPGRSHSQAWHSFKSVPPVEISPNHWRWELKDIPGLDLRDIPSRPEWAALAARMSVQWGEAAVEGTDNQWKAIGQWVTALEADRPVPSPEITSYTQSLIAGAPDFYTRLSRITDAVQKNIRYFVVMRGIGGLQANHAGDIFRNRYGDCKDKTTLLIAMLRVANINAWYVPVDDHRGIVDPDDPSLYGNHMITAIEIPADVNDPRLMAIVKAYDGKRYLIFDPTNERTPVGNLPSYLQGSYATLAAGPDSQVIALPVLPPDANGNVRKGTFALAADGTLTGEVNTVHSGPEGAELRLDLKESDEKERRDSLEMAIAHDVPGVVLNSFEFVQPPDLSKPLEVRYKLTAPQYAHHAGSLLLVRPRVVGSHAVPFDDKPRTVPIELNATGRWTDSFDITLPPGYVVDETPDPVNLDLDFASYHSNTEAKGNQLHYEREFVLKQVQLPASRAADFRKLEGTILMDEKGTAVLKKQ
jgi:transglutaminase-like putative cysteine protease